MKAGKTIIETSNVGGLAICVIFLGAFFFSLAISFMDFGNVKAYAVEAYSKDNPPFGIPYDKWISEYWNWWMTKTREEAYPQQGACLMNNSENMVMLMETASGGTRNLECNIKSNQAIMIPLWIGWCDTSPEGEKPLAGALLNCAKGANLGRIESTVRVDGVPIATLDVTMSSAGPKVDSMANVTEWSTGEFDLVVPNESHKAPQFTAPGKWLAASHGWWVFLNPLLAGQHEVYYDVGVTGAESGTSAAYTYTFNVS